jgi:hypothetical protein
MYIFSRRSKALAVIEEELAGVEELTIKDTAS